VESWRPPVAPTRDVQEGGISMLELDNPTCHQRRSIRLKGYDYSQAGAYFITVCTHNHECLFGNIDADEMHLNEVGSVVLNEWLKTPGIRSEIEMDACVVMPNHFHGIVVLTNDPANCISAGRGEKGDRPVAPTVHGPRPKSIGAMVAGFKAAVTKRINEKSSWGVTLWQRNYYEHLIRDDADYSRIAEYVATNPQRWLQDILHPDRKRT
jgi:putative transposase